MARYNNFDPNRLIKTLATDSANKEELLYRLKYYLQQIKKLETKAILLNKAIESEASFQASQDKWIR